MNKAHNQIGDEGCNHLAKAVWNLSEIYLRISYLN
jgi:hypothetical protein